LNPDPIFHVAGLFSPCLLVCHGLALIGLKFRRAGLGGLEFGNGYSRAMRWAAPLLLWLLLAASANAQSEPDEPLERGGRLAPSRPGATNHRDRAIELSQSLCPLIQSTAEQNGLPVEFFARLIWQESRLRTDAVGPVTRGGKRAQGIAQFMPATAAERLLLDAFDPAQALPKSAEFLRELRAQFGNLGLAAAAYNAGPQRVRDWLAGKRGLPSETLAYVRSVTGHSAEEWKKADVRTVTIPADTPCVGATQLAAKPATPTAQPPTPSAAWAVQLVGDRLESSALARYNQLQKKYQAILGGREPMMVRTMLGRAAIWHRIRIAAETREGAETLCSRLRAAGGTCLVQRN
jgi:hypothetical protein